MSGNMHVGDSGQLHRVVRNMQVYETDHLGRGLQELLVSAHDAVAFGTVAVGGPLFV